MNGGNIVASRMSHAGTDVDGLLKSLMLIGRTVEGVLESSAVEAAVNEPLASSKVQILSLLALRGGHTSSQVAHFLDVSKPAVSQIIDSMVASRLVVRRGALHDRREVILELTKQGMKWFAAIRREQRHVLRAALRHFPGNRTEQWTKVLAEIAAALAQASDNYSHFCLQCGAHADPTCVLIGGGADCPYLRHCAAAAGRAARRPLKQAGKAGSKAPRGARRRPAAKG